MRILIAAPLLLAAACSVQNDRQNGQTTIGFDETVVTNTTNSLERAAEDTGNEIERAGREIGNEVRSIDVDVNVRRDAQRNSN